MISIIIPAHNEATVIGRCLRSLLDGAAPGELEIIVVCNGCQDQTAGVARSFAGVKVIETATASKSHALNLGDKAASGFPRFFIDADVVLPRASLLAAAKALEDEQTLAAAPRMEVDLSASNGFVRAFYRIWTQLPYFRDGMIGSGAYGLSEAGRRRFDAFPAITADDAFVRLHFTAGERRTLHDCTFRVTAPRTLRGVVKIKTRGHFGNFELNKRYPHLLANNETRHGGALLALFRRPGLWPSLAIYLYVRGASRLLSYHRYRFGDHRHWERDDTSRQPVTSV